MKKILLLFILLSSLTLATENRTVKINLSKVLLDAMSLMKNSENFKDYAVSVVQIKKIYEFVEEVENYHDILEKNPLPSSNIIFEKLKLSKYDLLNQWNKSVYDNKPKNISDKKLREVRKLMVHVDQRFKPILDEVYVKVEDGYKFYLADNGVWLTDNIPIIYILS
jgi:hypothetical protein